MRHGTMIILLAAVAVWPLAAQPRGPMRGPGAERVEQLKKVRLMEVLKLDEETSVRFFARYNEHMDELKKIGMQRTALIDQLQLQVRTNAADSEIEAKLKEVSGVEDRILVERERFLKTAREILTVKQVAQYVVFERNFNQDLREMLREAAQERWRGRN